MLNANVEVPYHGFDAEELGDLTLIYAHYRVTGPLAEPATEARTTGPGAIRRLKFGDRHFVFSPQSNEGDAPGAAGVVPMAGAMLEKADRLQHVGVDTIHLVTQEGRLFQQRYPHIPVLLDACRFLVVSASPAEVAAIAVDGSQHFTITAVDGDDDVFDVCPCPSPRPQPDPAIERIVDRISAVAIKADIVTLASYPTRNAVTQHYRDAAAWAEQRLKSLGYATSMPAFDIAANKMSPTGRSLNVVADRIGTAGGRRSLVIVSAHLDSVWAPPEHEPPNALAPAPGADDNASGSAGVLEIARVLSDVPIEHDLRFILFGGEEEGLLGSERYVDKLLPMRDRKRIVAVVNMDMIAVDNNGASPNSVLLESGPVCRGIIAEMCTAAHTYTTLEVKTTLKPWNSDHVSFLKYGIPAVLVIEGDDSENHRIHMAADSLDYIDPVLAQQILRLNTAYVASKLGVTAASAVIG